MDIFIILIRNENTIDIGGVFSAIELAQVNYSKLRESLGFNCGTSNGEIFIIKRKLDWFHDI